MTSTGSTTAATTTADATDPATTDTEAGTPLPAAPPVDPRVIALAHYASRAVLERVIARNGLTFAQQITLRAAAVDGPLEREALVAQVGGALKADPAEVDATVGELCDKGLLSADGPLVGASDAGRELFAAVGAETAPITARIYAGIPAEDLAVAGRVLARVKERAEAELAALGATA
ncbi:MarR family transcriptional regulator [Streptomyces phaeofaciens]|uniref:MarR family transcriptional regulator n=1 Tax=Streptomyces phaeofaciens TaxID=68254 RepID=UPI0036B805A1